MTQYINVNTSNGKFLMPCYERNADAFKSGLTYNSTELIIQVAMNDFSFYVYSGANIIDATPPTGSNEIGFYQLNSDAWTVGLQLHSSVYSSLITNSGENIGLLMMSASGFSACNANLMFGPIDVNLIQVNGIDASGASSVSISESQVRSAVGLTSANLDTQLSDIPTVSEFNARTIPSGDYINSIGIRTALGMGSANMDTQLSNIQSDINIIPKSGETWKYTQIAVNEGLKTADVSIGGV